MAGASITFRVDERERDELVSRAVREKVNLSDYIRVRLGLRAQGSEGDVDVEIGSQLERTLQDQMADHERRLQALEGDAGRASGQVALSNADNGNRAQPPARRRAPAARRRPAGASTQRRDTQPLGDVVDLAQRILSGSAERE